MKMAEKDDSRRTGNTLPKFRVSVNAERSSTSTTVKTSQNSDTKTIFHIFPTSSRMDKPTCQRAASLPRTEQGSLKIAYIIFTHPNLLNYFAYLWFKSHVKHPVCFIQNQICATSQIGCSCLKEVNQATWSCNTYLYSTPQIPCL